MKYYCIDKAAKRCLILALLIASGITYTNWGAWLLITLTWIALIPFTKFLAFCYGFGAQVFFGRAPHDYTEGEPFEEDEIVLTDWMSPDDEGVIYEGKIIGKYMDANIHEYILIDHPEQDGVKVKAKYDNVVDMNGAWEPPEDVWFILLEPGILYITDPEPEIVSLEAPQAA